MRPSIAIDQVPALAAALLCLAAVIGCAGCDSSIESSRSHSSSAESAESTATTEGTGATTSTAPTDPTDATNAEERTEPAKPQAGSSVAAPAADDWETFTDSARGVSFRYPAELATAYIHAVDWPPQLAVESGPFTCTEAGTETARAGRTERTALAGRTYCVTRVTEGAAGSIYTLYAYAMPQGDEVVILTFSLRRVQCGHYDEPSRNECERERASFSIDRIVDAIARTIRLEA